ncbi:MAG: preprotein translocase subunit SecE [Candidatus Magasanikbacteria bacterium]|nr:preprotein translocase subunit SecE [Candidatus Magasanikbacteria bacterium]
MALFGKISLYLKESILELKKVVWPSRTQTINLSIVVIAMSIGVAVFFAVLDNVFNLGVEYLIK